MLLGVKLGIGYKYGNDGEVAFVKQKCRVYCSITSILFIFILSFYNYQLTIKLMGIIKEFKEFAIKGNVVDLAVAVIIGGAFGRIVSSFVDDIIMPPLGLLLGGVDFRDLRWVMREAYVDEAGAEIAAVSLNYGAFIQNIVDFLIIAAAIFMAIKALNSLKRKEEAAPAPPPPMPPKEEILLTEIRDILKSQQPNKGI